MSAPLSLVSINIEGSKHLDLAEPFLRKRRPDVCCIQELARTDIARFENALGTSCFFVPMLLRPFPEGLSEQGIGIFSRVPSTATDFQHYAGSFDGTTPFDITTQATKHRTERYVLVRTAAEKDGVRYRIGTTHFTWTPDGQPDDFQREDMRALFSVLDEEKEGVILCGDFNAPRGGEIFAMLAARYADTIPPEYETSIDVSLHRDGKTRPELLHRMVDGLFTTPEYEVFDVGLVSGVSDHMAIVADVTKRF